MQRDLRRPRLIALGALLALGIPTASIVVAALWSLLWIEPDPNGPLVVSLQQLALTGLLVAVPGLIIAAWAAGTRKPLTWAAVLLWGVPLLAIAWFVGAAWLGGLAGEPF